MPSHTARLIALSALSLSSAAFADDSPDTIVVTATRSEQPLSRIGQTITVIDQDTITTRQTVTVVDLLRTVPGVTIARNGGIGGTSSVFIRGADSDQTAALIDGIKLNDPSAPGGGFNFGNLMIGNIARIEVLRGPQSVLWGSQAIGGVINMITIPPSEDLKVNVRGEYGYRDTGQIVGNISGKTGPLSASVGAGYFRTDGISAVDERMGGIEKDGYRNYGANANFNLALSEDISVDLRGWYSHGRNNFDDNFPAPTFTIADSGAYGVTRELVGYTGVNAKLLDGRFHNRLGFAYTDIRRRNYNPVRGSTPTFAANGRNERIEYQGSYDISDGWQAMFGAENERSHLTTSNGTPPETRKHATINSVYGQIVATPIAGFTATGGVRYDHHNQFGGATTFGASGVWTPNAGKTELRASYSEGFKAPTLFQLYSDFGNKHLDPERAKGWDAGITQRLLDGAIEASATWFHRNSRDLINFVSCSTSTGICVGRPFGTYENVAKARAQGVELALTLRPIEPLKVQANYSWVDAENRTPGNAAFGKDLVRRPRQSVNTSIDYRWPFGLSTGATLTHVGSSFDNATNTRKVQGYVLADLRASFPVTKNVELYGRIENLFDEHYETIFRYGTPGRAAYAGVRLSY